MPLCRLTDNDHFAHAWESLEGSIRMSIMFAGTERAIRNMDVARHEAIVDAIASGDAAAAATAVHEHIESAAANLTR
jgi:DNA-binding FadR family transcriptional regulator